MREEKDRIGRRVAAVVMPDIACEIVRQRARAKGPLGVVLAPSSEDDDAPIDETAVLDAVSAEAKHYGVRVGQRVTEAAALVSSLAVHRVTYEELDAALGRAAEMALSLAPTASIQLASSAKRLASAKERRAFPDAPFDTVWLDITGAAHLVGGEAALLDELTERIGALGHRVRTAIAQGPRIAQALARWAAAPSGGEAHAIATPGNEARAMANLPIYALPITSETASWLVRLGLLRVGDLARLSRAEARSRLGERAREVLDLLAGIDDAPLVPFEPPRFIEEETRFEEGVESTEALLFVLRGMTSRASARLAARGEACTRIELHLPYDRSIALLRGAASPALSLVVDLPAPLAREADLLRALKAKLERAALAAPAVAARLVLPQIVTAPKVQLDLSRDAAVNPDNLPALLAELSAEIGPACVGVLAIADSHRPEARSKLVPAITASGDPTARVWMPKEPTRLLDDPVPLGRVHAGAVIAVDKQLYAIERLRFAMRLDGVEWWKPQPAARDYAVAWLAGGAGDAARSSRTTSLLAPRSEGESSPSAEALIFVDRATGEGFLQGWNE